eukprot:4637141-Heterocapsa_arctica.AAC.1
MCIRDRSRRDDVPKEYRLHGLLDRIKEVLKIAAALHPPFHGELEGYDTEAIRESNNRRSRMHIRRHWEGDSEEQLQWE